jgi:hypothetical protein
MYMIKKLLEKYLQIPSPKDDQPIIFMKKHTQLTGMSIPNKLKQKD